MRIVLLALTILAALLSPSFAGAIAEGSYRFTGRDEATVLAGTKVDLWAEVYRPAELGTSRHPLLVFLHGNHGTCGRFDRGRGVRVDDNAEYTIDGKCPAGYTVTPNHLGYAYLARALAARGYVVVSINANRGITAGVGDADDSGLNLARGRLILRHLALLSDWNRGAGAIAVPATLGFDPKGTLDFAQVGLLGHSRGGEGARAALVQWRDAGSVFPAMIGPMTIRAIFEIGPVDGQTARVLDAKGVASMILLPSCDGDVSTLEGMSVFDRTFGFVDDTVRAPRGTFEVWGANHNAYNTEWLESDSFACTGAPALFPQAGRSSKQQQTALVPVLRFFQATVGAHRTPALADLFDPSSALPRTLTAVTHVQRGYLPAAPGDGVKLLETFSRTAAESDAGVPYAPVGLTVANTTDDAHPAAPRIARVTWSGGIATRRFDIGFVRKGGVDLSGFSTLSLRTAVGCAGGECAAAADPKGAMEFKVRLIGTNGRLSAPLSTAGRIALTEPVGMEFERHRMLATVSFDLAAFGMPLRSVAGIRLVFDSRADGDVDIGTIVATTKPVTTSGTVAPAPVAASAAVIAAPVATTAPEAGNRIRFLPADAPAVAGRSPGALRLELTSRRPFPFTDSLPELAIGDLRIRDVAVVGDGRTAIARLSARDAAALVPGSEVTLKVGRTAPLWRFGALPTR
ncbi:hypothetical protein [Oharaeibacter diazotrophicus]|uniref:Chlorophyllase-like protein n=1 Tax=Oharaeibacter diazotrophicus TaxID=1920512 RepID=A0A4R6RH08_9HYPH|nr:hypothetical protein [Oharaeibacter diazotrophicus]TDP85620.1 hypothetical protein EDD54_2475 [Oharaeibacter diazotrophicus]BBE74586.1 alpha/beta hydrolase family protein [Pleomorphomonas sp. SM30]GLS75709.1 hypothetical protein GCM10007904_10440 [Oharaeibacter diazotrophicus]